MSVIKLKLRGYKIEKSPVRQIIQLPLGSRLMFFSESVKGDIFVHALIDVTKNKKRPFYLVVIPLGSDEEIPIHNLKPIGITPNFALFEELKI